MVTTENNKLIAEFMGGNKYGIQYTDEDTDIFYGHNETKYHISWDWLMPVVEKIYNYTRQLEFEDEKYIHITEEIFDTDHTFADFWTNDISGIYERVIEFINWYNKQQHGNN